MHGCSRFQRRSSVLSSATALAVVAALLEPVCAQPRRAYWIVSGATPQAESFTAMVRAIVGSAFDVREPAADPAPTAGESVVRQLRSVGGQDLVFLSIDQPTLEDVLLRDSTIVSTLGLEPMNVGVSAAPFYLFAQAGMAESLRRQAGTARRILYVDKLGALQPADVAALLDPLLRTKSVVVGPLGSPQELARRLVSGSTDIVGIYDDDPSAFRNDFIRAYEDLRPKGEPARLQALKLVMFP